MRLDVLRDVREKFNASKTNGFSLGQMWQDSDLSQRGKRSLFDLTMSELSKPNLQGHKVKKQGKMKVINMKITQSEAFDDS